MITLDDIEKMKEVRRMRYFNELFLKQEEFVLDQNYHIRMRRLHNRRLHSRGIVWGLEVKEGTKSTSSVKISPGMALNKVTAVNGEEVSQEIIYFDENYEIDLGENTAAQNEGVYIYISRDEKKDHIEEQKGGSEEIHWLETAEITVNQSKHTDEKYIILAKVKLINKKVSIETEDRVYAGAYGKLALSVDGEESTLSIEGKKFETENGIQVKSPITEFTGTLEVQSVTTGGLHVGGTSDPGDNNLVVDGNCTIEGTLEVKSGISGGLHVGGDSDPGDKNLEVDGNCTIDGTLEVKSGISGGLHVGGTSDPGDKNLEVDGNCTIEGTLEVKSGISGGLHVGGDSDPGDKNLEVEGDCTIKGNLFVKKNPYVINDVVIGDNIFTLNQYEATENGLPLEINAGLEVYRGGTAPKAQIIWDESADKWKIGVEDNLVDLGYGIDWDTLINYSIADDLHKHSKLVSPDGSTDPVLSVDDDGNVGIGTAPSATERLIVKGTIRADAIISDKLDVPVSLKANEIIGGRFFGDGSNLTGIATSQWYNDLAGIYYKKNVGIGTTPTATDRLSIDGNIKATSISVSKISADSFSLARNAEIKGDVDIGGYLNVMGTVNGNLANDIVDTIQIKDNAVTEAKLDQVIRDKLANPVPQDLLQEIKDARGIKLTLGNRLDESLAKGGQLRSNVVGMDQLDTLTKGKLVTNGDSHDHSGGDGAMINHSSLKLDDDTTNPHRTTAVDVGALPITGGTLSGDLQVNGSKIAGNFTSSSKGTDPATALRASAENLGSGITQGLSVYASGTGTGWKQGIISEVNGNGPKRAGEFTAKSDKDEKVTEALKAYADSSGGGDALGFEAYASGTGTGWKMGIASSASGNGPKRTGQFSAYSGEGTDYTNALYSDASTKGDGVVDGLIASCSTSGSGGANALHASSSSSGSGPVNGIIASCSSSGSGSVTGLSVDAFGTGSAMKHGIFCQVTGNGSKRAGQFVASSKESKDGDTIALYATSDSSGIGRVDGLQIHASSSGTGPVYGVYGLADGAGTGPKYGIYGAVRGEGKENWAGYFEGDVLVKGVLSKSSGSFLIDHPLDPLNKTLRHSFVESPEDLCLYRGKVKLDSKGRATVKMPEYFSSLTKEEEATVTLTPIGKKPFLLSYEWNSKSTAFTIYGEPNAEATYIVLADRDDPTIHHFRRPVEEDKGEGNFEKGELLCPEAIGRKKGIARVKEEIRHVEVESLKILDEHRKIMEEEQKRMGEEHRKMEKEHNEMMENRRKEERRRQK